jgi:alpha-1,2-glucosyltransferase
MPTLLQNWPLQAVLVVTSGLSLTWHNLISKHVPQPYLVSIYDHCVGDTALSQLRMNSFMYLRARNTVMETIHGILRSQHPQACKMTLHPSEAEGLLTKRYRYIVAKLFRPIFGCSTASLRALNVVAACLICLTSYDILRLLRARIVQDPDEPTSIQVSIRKESLRDSTTLLDANTALNVALFPPLFFFSALFYTDVMSTLVVLLSYSVLLRKRTTSGTLSENITTVSVGLLALLFRQTNIFWVAVFPGALTVVAALKADTPHAESRKTATIGEVLQHSWSSGAIHDNTVQDAAFQGTRIWV